MPRRRSDHRIVQTNANLFKTQVAGVDVDGCTPAPGRTPAPELPPVRHLYEQVRRAGTGRQLHHFARPGPERGRRRGAALEAQCQRDLGSRRRSADAAQNYQKSYTDAAANLAPAATARRKVDAYQTFDLQFGYAGIATPS
jgi:iron complex outermembrane receptor protein